LPEFYYNPDCFRVPEADSTVYGKYRLTTTPPVKKSDMTIVAEDLFFDPSLACRVFGSMPKVYEFHITHFCVDPGRYIYNLESYDFQDFLDEKIDSYTNYSSRRIDVVDSKTYCDESYCEISACNLRENEDEDWLCALGNNNQTYYILFAYIVGVIYLMKSRKQH
jgi:hypothetical protein